MHKRLNTSVNEKDKWMNKYKNEYNEINENE